MKKEHKERLRFILSVVLYGTVGMCMRFAALPSEAAALYRGVIAVLFLLLYRLVRREKADRAAIRSNALLLVLSGVALGLNWICLFAAYEKTTVAIASLCDYMAPIFVIILTPFVLKQKLDGRKIPCIAAAFFGIVLVSGIIGGSVGNPVGIVSGLTGAVCFAGLVFCNCKMRDVSAMDRTTVQLAVSVVVILPYVLIKNGGIPLPTLGAWPLVLMLGVLQTGVAYVLYFGGIAALPVQTVAILGYLEPVISVLCSVIFLHEPLGWMGWIGAVMILSAAAVSELMPERTEKVREPGGDPHEDTER